MASDFTTHHVEKQSSSNFPWGIVLACILFLSFLLWSKWDRINQFFSSETVLTTALEDTGFVVGTPITLEWELRADGDFVTHTHTLLTQSSGIFGLKSKTLDLNQYSGTISIDGVVALQSNSLVIVEVSAVMNLNPVIATGTVLSGEVNTGDISTGEILPVSTGTTAQIVPSTGTIVSNTAKTALSIQGGIEQFPVTIGTGTLFTSSRGHTMLFPSKKISYQGVNIAATDFGVKGLRCYTQMNVIDYANKANILTMPAVKIFECTHKTDTFPSQFASIVLDDGRVFLIEATDPAWGNFANAVEITAAVTTN